MLLSGALGVALAIVYGMASFAVNTRALKSTSQQRFLAIMVGGMMARFAAVFFLLLIALLFLPLHHTALVVSFLITFIPVLAFEVVQLHARADAFLKETPS